jgi:mannose-1-phosphate guanylyltransferase
MAGGVGARLWPLSNNSTPKQFIDVLGDGQTLIQKTFQRFARICPKENIYIVTNKTYETLTREQLPELTDNQIILEPFRRDTAPCIAYANYKIKAINPNAVVVVAPSDHYIEKEDVFVDVIQKGLEITSQSSCLLTIGIQPTSPNTGYGYIQYDEDEPLAGNPSVYAVKTFTEKPELEMAKSFIDSGEFLWNAGIFMWKASVIAEELERYAPEITAQWNGWEQFVSTPHQKDYLQRIYADMPRTSIDYAVMEKSQRVMAIPSFFDWNDLGNWNSLFEYFASPDGNAVKVSGDKLLSDTKGDLIVSSHKDKLLAIKGLKDYLVIDTPDVLLICPREENTLKSFISYISKPEFEKYK